MFKYNGTLFTGMTIRRRWNNSLRLRVPYRIGSSIEPETTAFPSGENATDYMGLALYSIFLSEHPRSRYREFDP